MKNTFYGALCAGFESRGAIIIVKERNGSTKPNKARTINVGSNSNNTHTTAIAVQNEIHFIKINNATGQANECEPSKPHWTMDIRYERSWRTIALQTNMFLTHCAEFVKWNMLTQNLPATRKSLTDHCSPILRLHMSSCRFVRFPAYFVNC